MLNRIIGFSNTLLGVVEQCPVEAVVFLGGYLEVVRTSLAARELQPVVVLQKGGRHNGKIVDRGTAIQPKRDVGQARAEHAA